MSDLDRCATCMKPTRSCVCAPDDTRRMVEEAMRAAHPLLREHVACRALAVSVAVALVEKERAKVAEKALAESHRLADSYGRALADVADVLEQAGIVRTDPPKMAADARDALAEARERWGHAINCECLLAWPDLPDTPGSGGKPYRDPRCAPPPAAEPTSERCGTCGSDDPTVQRDLAGHDCNDEGFHSQPSAGKEDK